ncbi:MULTISPECIES: thioredoxin family protein [unclassified Bradyrhizobium]|uniref:thioredoxin family protein n=1 Tax=unclassified Bradyrhizobium TaxID=2631580 RepID=UPI00247A0E43|nr:MULTISPECIES: thioredoxin family protein [unclassified Bradyrhizobium]WGS24098.1 thioredoxin family protein [Bradyrhizobium sp. ISRA463]WGS31407.1 thioredoxin family protein [Bradyrhizobium sp. ISRA464]
MVLLPRTGLCNEVETAKGFVPFNAAELDELHAAGTPVFPYFTTAWCLTCKVNERLDFDQPNTRKAFAEAGVITMVGNWTNGDPAIMWFRLRWGGSGAAFDLWYRSRRDGGTSPFNSTPSLRKALRTTQEH